MRALVHTRKVSVPYTYNHAIHRIFLRYQADIRNISGVFEGIARVCCAVQWCGGTLPIE